MGRLRRFSDFRFVGLRDTMKVYDCDDDGQFALLEERVMTDSLVERNLVSSFGPDTETEAINRGFRAL
jgi:hypothetical protein